MKLLMLFTERFAYSPAHKTLKTEPDCSDSDEIHDAVIGLIHAEAVDEENAGGVETHRLKIS